MIRLFAGIGVRKMFNEDFLKARGQLKTGLQSENVHWTTEPNLHLTLCFLGTQKEEKIPEISQIMSSIAKGSYAFPVEFQGFGGFPNPDSVKVGYVAVRKSPELESLSKELTDKMFKQKILLEKDPVTYTPHVTLFKTGRGLYLSPTFQKFSQTTFGSGIIDHLTLFESHSADSGVEYLPLENFPFRLNDSN